VDADGAKIYAVETKRVNEAGRNNPEKFPPGTVIETFTKTRQLSRTTKSLSDVKDDKMQNAFMQKSGEIRPIEGYL
jgi:hypothetical protein